MNNNLHYSEIFDEEKYRLEEEMQRDNRRVISWGRSSLSYPTGPMRVLAFARPACTSMQSD